MSKVGPEHRYELQVAGSPVLYCDTVEEADSYVAQWCKGQSAELWEHDRYDFPTERVKVYERSLL